MTRQGEVDDMKTEKASGKVGSMWGKEFPKPLTYTYEYEAFESYDEIVKANKVPSHDDIVKLVNDDVKLAARSKQALKRIDDEFKATGNTLYQKPDPNSVEFVTDQMIRLAMKRNPKLTPEQARAYVESVEALA
jgi:hypothetical protein